MAARPKRIGEGRPSHVPTDVTLKTAKAMAGYGITRKEIAAVLGISYETLVKHYGHVMATAATEANAAVAQTMFQMATRGKSVAAGVFWLRSRAKWKDTVAVEHVMKRTLEDMTDDELLALASPSDVETIDGEAIEIE